MDFLTPIVGARSSRSHEATNHQRNHDSNTRGACKASIPRSLQETAPEKLGHPSRNSPPTSQGHARPNQPEGRVPSSPLTMDEKNENTSGGSAEIVSVGHL